MAFAFVVIKSVPLKDVPFGSPSIDKNEKSRSSQGGVLGPTTKMNIKREIMQKKFF